MANYQFKSTDVVHVIASNIDLNYLPIQQKPQNIEETSPTTQQIRSAFRTDQEIATEGTTSCSSSTISTSSTTNPGIGN